MYSLCEPRNPFSKVTCWIESVETSSSSLALTLAGSVCLCVYTEYMLTLHHTRVGCVHVSVSARVGGRARVEKFDV